MTRSRFAWKPAVSKRGGSAVGRSVLLASAVAFALCLSVPAAGALTHASSVKQVTAAGSYYHYVTNRLRFGKTVAQADAYAFDLNHDGVLDNALGHIFAGLSSMLNFDPAIARSLETGSVVVLNSLRADSLKADSSASWQVYLGQPKPHPVLTGGGSFAIEPGGPTSTKLGGAITHGQFEGGPGEVTLKLSLLSGQPPIDAHIAGARIQARCDPDGCRDGKVGGGIRTAEMNSVIIPALARSLQSFIDASCGPTPSADSCSPSALNILALFDINNDHKVTADELRANSLIRAISQPDLDLFDANGMPGQDGIDDSVSLGMGFTSKCAVFDVAGQRQVPCGRG